MLYGMIATRRYNLLKHQCQSYSLLYQFDSPKIVLCCAPLSIDTKEVEYRLKMAQQKDNKVPFKDEQPLPSSSHKALAQKRSRDAQMHNAPLVEQNIAIQNPNMFRNPFYQPIRMCQNPFDSYQSIPLQIGNQTIFTTYPHQLNAMSYNNANENDVHMYELSEPEFGEPIGTTCRKWRNTPFGSRLEKQSGAQKPGLVFKIMSYNVLAQYLLEMLPQLYVRNNPSCLNWEKRWDRLVHEIKLHDSDILCLQEVQESHLNSHYNQILHQLGYVGIFKKRTGNHSDGCAMYFKKDIFKLIEHTTVEYRQDSIIETSLLDRDNVAIIAKLAPLCEPNATFIVATTHLLYNPRRSDVRLAQTQILLAEIERLAFIDKNVYAPMIITGDFNALPTSAVLNLLINSKLSYSQLSRRSLKEHCPENKINGKIIMPHELGITDNCQHQQLLALRKATDAPVTRDQELTVLQLYHSKRKANSVNANCDQNIFSTGHLTHNFCLSSVYNIEEKSGTTYQEEWITVDYIFYSVKTDGRRRHDEKLKLISTYTLPRAEHLHEVAIPNNYVGSDHLSLIAQFKLEF